MDDEENVTLVLSKDRADLINTLFTAIDQGDRTTISKINKDNIEITNNRKYILSLEDPNHKPTQYMKLEEVDTAYQYALNTKNPTPEDCFKRVVEEHGVTVEYIEESKDNPTFHTKEVIERHIGHPSVLRMRDNKVFDIVTLKHSTTPNNLINTVTTRKTVSDRLDDLEQEVSTLSYELSDLKLRMLGTDIAIHDLNTTLFGVELTKEKQKENSIHLRTLGYRIKDIAKILNISESSVKRYTATKAHTLQQSASQHSP